MGARHMVGIGAVTLAAVAAPVAGDAPAFVEDLDDPAGHAGIDLRADPRMGTE